MNNETMATYFNKPAKVKCDRNCHKAWGRNSRPRQKLSDGTDVYLADDELSKAPINPGTYEGGIGKPLSPAKFPQRWCIRECERCVMSAPGEYDKPLKLIDWSKPVTC